MTITKADEIQLREWFLQLHNCTEKGTELKLTLIEYYDYREKIAKLVLKKLNNLFQIKKFEWDKRNHINEDDAISIIHDALLISLNKFKLTANVKFITFFWRVLHSTLFNFIKKYKKVKPSQRKHIPAPLLHSLDHLQWSHSIIKSKIGNGRYTNQSTRLIGSVIEKLVTLEQTDESKNDCRFLVEHMMERLSIEYRYILESILQGETTSDIAKELSITREAVRIKIKRIREKFRHIEEQLCQTRKQ